MSDLEMTGVRISHKVGGASVFTAYPADPMTVSLPSLTRVRVNRTNTMSTATKKGKGIPDPSDMTARFEYSSSIYDVLEDHEALNVDSSFEATIASGDKITFDGQVMDVKLITEAGQPAYIDVIWACNTLPVYTAAA